MHQAALLKAIRLFGTQKALAKKIRVNPRKLNNWVNRDKTIPGRYVLAIEHATEGKVSRYELDPQLEKTSKNINIEDTSCTFVKIKSIPISDIPCKKIHQNDLPIIKLLAQKIKEGETLQPIIITEQYQLIFGESLLQAYQLAEKYVISAWVISFNSMINTECSQDIINKKFTLIERVAIGMALENWIGNRQGQRTDKKLIQNFIGVSKGATTRAIAASYVGVANPETYRQAKKILHAGIPELIQAVDEKRISISAAVYLIELPLDKLKFTLTCDKKSAIAAAKEIKATKKHSCNDLNSRPL